MSCIQLIIGIVVVGLILWLVNTYIPMQSGVKKILSLILGLLVAVFTRREERRRPLSQQASD